MNRREIIQSFAAAAALPIAGRAGASDGLVSEGGDGVPDRTVEEYGEDYLQVVANTNGWTSMLWRMAVFDWGEVVTADSADGLVDATASRQLAPEEGNRFAALWVWSRPVAENLPDSPPDLGDWTAVSNGLIYDSEHNPPMTADIADAPYCGVRVGDWVEELWGRSGKYGDTFGVLLFEVPEFGDYVTIGAFREGGEALRFGYSIEVE